MVSTTISLWNDGFELPAWPVPSLDGPMIDSYGRRIDYLRISLTDACNLRCVYCMPEEMRFKPRAELLQDDEILAIVRAAAELGTTKIRLTGGEPTIRPGMVELVRSIAAAPGIDKVAMTTNGLLLAELAEPLAQAGLRAINVSIDTLNPAKFRRITRWGDLHRVWDGVAAAEAAGIHPLKLNAVVTRGFNEDEVTALARLSIDRPWHIRFIELMPFGSVADFQQESVVSSQETRARSRRTLGRSTRCQAKTATTRPDPTAWPGRKAKSASSARSPSRSAPAATAIA